METTPLLPGHLFVRGQGAFDGEWYHPIQGWRTSESSPILGLVRNRLPRSLAKRYVDKFLRQKFILLVAKPLTSKLHDSDLKPLWYALKGLVASAE